MVERARPRLDLSAVELPLALSATPRTIDRATANGWVVALGERAAASWSLVERGIVPPQGVAGSTIFLAYSHYDLSGGVYSREQVTFHRPIRLDEPLEVWGEIAYAYPRRGHHYRVMTSRTTGEGGLAVSSRSTSVSAFRSTHLDEEEHPKGRDAAHPAPDAAPAAGNPHGERLRRLRAGDSFSGESQVVTLEMMRAWDGGASNNPIHTDPERARREGLGRPIAGGPHVLAFAQELLMEELGAEVFLFGAHVDARWISPVRTDTAVVPSAVVETVGDDRVVIQIEVACDGEPAMVGRVVIPLARR